MEDSSALPKGIGDLAGLTQERTQQIWEFWKSKVPFDPGSLACNHNLFKQSGVKPRSEERWRK